MNPRHKWDNNKVLVVVRTVGVQISTGHSKPSSAKFKTLKKDNLMTLLEIKRISLVSNLILVGEFHPLFVLFPILIGFDFGIHSEIRID